MLSSPVGNASSFLYGIQAKRVFFNGSCAGASDPQPAKPGIFSSGEPSSFLQVWQVPKVIEHDDGKLVVGGRGWPRWTIWSPRC